MMARPIKVGVKYFSMDISFFTDMKIKKLLRKCGSNGVVAYIYLLSNIYSDKGYYMQFDDLDDLYFDIAYTINIEEDEAKNIIEYLLKINLFDREIFEKYNTLTSRGIQIRYIRACENINRSQINVLENLDLTKNFEEIVSSEETGVSSLISATKKRKEKKKEEKKIKENRSEEKKEKREISQIPISEFENIFSPYTQENKYLIFSDIFKKWQIIREKTNWLTKNGTMITDYINDFEHFINLEITFWRQNEHQRKAGVQSRTNGASKPLTSEEFDKYLAD